jgi:hypothetical protein
VKSKDDKSTTKGTTKKTRMTTNATVTVTGNVDGDDNGNYDDVVIVPKVKTIIDGAAMRSIQVTLTENNVT